MNTPESLGEPSCKRQENGDVANGSDRPLKKARFAWQVKGKYHLKNETADKTNMSQSSRKDLDISDSSENESDTNDLVGNTEQNLEILGDYLLKQDFNTLDSVIADHDKSLLNPAVNISPETLNYAQYVCSYDSKASNNANQDSIPMSMVISQTYNEDQCIARWQARQMAKGFVDNTINRVLDSWMITPLPADIDNNRFLALDVAEFINNLPGDNTIENEGILMAISAHGLQNTSPGSSSDINTPTSGKLDSSDAKDDMFPSPPTSPIPSDDEHATQKHSDNEIEMSSWSFRDDIQNTNDIKQLNFYPETYKNFNENDQERSVNISYDGNANVGENDNLCSHFDFLDAAVSFAIQNKGLTSYGTDYG